MSLPEWVQPGAKAYAKLHGREIAALVLEIADSHNGEYVQVRLRIAVKNHLTGSWIVSPYPKPVQSYKLKQRATTIPELDTTLPDQFALPVSAESDAGRKPEQEAWPFYPAGGTGRVPKAKELETWLRYWSRLRGYPRLQYARGDSLKGQRGVVEQGEAAWSSWFEQADYDDLIMCFAVADVYDIYDYALPRPWAANTESGDQAAEFRCLKELGQHVQDESEDQACERHFRED